MGLQISIQFPSFAALMVFFSIIKISSAAAASDYTAYVYKGCAEQHFPDPPDAYAATIQTLFNTFVPQSLNASFSFATAGQGSSTAIYGLYQCRGDLNPTQCHDCVSQLPLLSSKFCGTAVAARVQLAGCYSRYEVVGFKQVADTEFLYRFCGSGLAGGSEFESRRDTVFGMVAKGVAASGLGYYAGEYQDVYALGQCEGDLGSDQCGECVNVALSNLKAGCADAVSGQSYLLKCYANYSYTNGVPSVVESEAKRSPSGGRKGDTQRIVAIAVGGVAVLVFVIACLMFFKSVFKKKEKKHGGYYTYQ